MFGGVRELYKSRYLLGVMVKKSIKNQYRNSILGALWTLLDPLLHMIVLSFVFSYIFNRGGQISCYPVYLLSGTIVFDLLRKVSTISLPSIVDNQGLVKRVRVPYSIFSVSSLFSNLVNMGFSFIALILVMLILGQPISWTIVMTIVYLPALLLFVLGVSLFLSAVYVFFRDIKHIYTVVLTLWTYLTPLFYTVNTMPAKVFNILRLNPMYHYVKVFRDIVTGGIVPDITHWLIIYACGFISIGLGSLIFRLTRKKFILYI